MTQVYGRFNRQHVLNRHAQVKKPQVPLSHREAFTKKKAGLFVCQNNGETIV